MELLKLYKNKGETPLECIERFRVDNPKYKDTKMTYAGRLDPMAEGLLLVLAGDTTQKEKYLGLNKTYEFEVLLGVETDTHDILGIVKLHPIAHNFTIQENINSVLEKVKNIKKQKYPAFSSRTVFGKPLFSWARRGELKEDDIPEKEINIFDIKYLGVREINKKELLEQVISRIQKVKGDFRQSEIIATWETALKNSSIDSFVVAKFVADVSSGTYIRGLAHKMGKILGTGAIAYSIKRTKVGDFIL